MGKDIIGSVDYEKIKEKIEEVIDTKLKPTRTTPIQDLSGASIAAGGVQNIDKSGLNDYAALVVIVKATYDASATAGVRVRWRYSPLIKLPKPTTPNLTLLSFNTG